MDTEQLTEAMQHLDPITKALREYIERHPTMMHAVGLTDLCDNIDAIHKALEQENADMRDFCERVEQAAQARENVTLWGVDYTAMPLDADRVPIHVGDEMQSVIEPASHGTVYRMELGRDGWWIYFGSVGTRPEKSRHHHKPTVTDVLREFLNECENSMLLGYPEVPQELFGRFAKRLQLAEGDANE